MYTLLVMAIIMAGQTDGGVGTSFTKIDFPNERLCEAARKELDTDTNLTPKFRTHTQVKAFCIKTGDR